MIRKGVIAPAEISVSQKMRPLSVGTMLYDSALCDVEGLDFVQVFFPDGGSEFYRIKTSSDVVGELNNCAMEHSIVWLEDYICTEKTTFNGTIAELLEKILGYATETKWRLGVVECTETVKVDINYTNVMQGVVDALDLCYGYNYTFDQSGELWYINLVALPDTAECEGRLSRNLVNAVINVDYRDFATRLYVPGKTWHVDSESQAFWGLRENTLEADTQGVDDEELREQCYKYFRDHSVPPVSVSVEAHELGRITGQSFDWFSPGKMCRLCLIDYNGAVVTERITDRTYPSLITNPDIVVLTMANKLPNASGAINGLAVTMKTIQTKTETALEDLWMGIVDVDGQLTSEINAVSIRLDAEAARIDLKAEQTQVNDLESHVTDVIIDLNAMDAELSAKVAKDGVIAAINLSPEVARISAGKIVLDGYVLAEQFEALNASITNLTTGITEASVLKASITVGTTVTATNTFVYRQNTMYLRNLSMGNIVSTPIMATGSTESLNLQHSHAIVVGENGVLQLGEVAETGGNFNIADTQYFKDAVSAAKDEGYEEGRNSIVLEPITINQNGTYTPAQGVDGYNSIVVNVSSSSGVPTLSNATYGGNSLLNLAQLLNVTPADLIRCFSSVTVHDPGYYGFKVTAGGVTKNYYFIVT